MQGEVRMDKMPRLLRRLKPVALNRFAKAPGRYPDGGGLYLDVTSPTAASWVYRYQLQGRVGNLGLGSYPAISLARARERAAEARTLKAEGIDPLQHRRASRAATVAAAAKQKTFREAAAEYIAANEVGWSNKAHAKQWAATLETYAYPIIGDFPARDIDAALVLKILQPIWSTKTETASRVRGRIEAVLDWSKSLGYRTGDNPAAWKGNLRSLLPAPSRLKKIEHRAAMPYQDVAAFMVKLRSFDGAPIRALQFAILTACRSIEVRGTDWREIDVKAKLWTVPAGRMKLRREHRVPLSAAALALLGQSARGLVFGKLSADNLMGSLASVASGCTVHGFRSSFKDWASEQTSFSNEVVEAALAHAIGAVERAYRRSDLFELRRELMEAWATYCAGGEVGQSGITNMKRPRIPGGD
jgi:integrase